MKNVLKLFIIFIFSVSCQGTNEAFDAFSGAAYTFYLVNKTEGRIKDVDILTSDGTVSHSCGRMAPDDKCTLKFSRKPDALRIVYKADPVMGLGMKFDDENVEQIWKFHRPSVGRYERYNLTLDEDYFSLTAANLSTTEGRFIDGFGFNNFGNPIDVDDYELLSEYLNTPGETLECISTEIDTKLYHTNITPSTFIVYGDDDSDPLTPVVQLGADDGLGSVVGPGLTSGSIDYGAGAVVLSMSSEPMGDVFCRYHAPLGLNGQIFESKVSLSVSQSNPAWLGFYKKADFLDVIKNIFILKRNTFGMILGYWEFDIENDETIPGLLQNESGTYVFNIICTEDGYH